MAPEILTAGCKVGYGNKVDVFSAGITMYVMLCGYEPFYGESEKELIEANKAAVIEFPESDWSNGECRNSLSALSSLGFVVSHFRIVSVRGSTRFGAKNDTARSRGTTECERSPTAPLDFKAQCRRDRCCRGQ